MHRVQSSQVLQPGLSEKRVESAQVAAQGAGHNQGVIGQKCQGGGGGKLKVNSPNK